jgi:guanine deaminase
MIAMYDPNELMRLAIEKCREGMANGNSPFGCAIARGDRVLAVSHNVVWDTTDITAHAEVTALREACKSAQQILLEDCVVATTCEPCPMCMSALHWARVTKVYFGASIADASEAGFNELSISAQDIVRQGGSPVELFPNTLREECRQLFADWKAAGGQAY